MPTCILTLYALNRAFLLRLVIFYSIWWCEQPVVVMQVNWRVLLRHGDLCSAKCVGSLAHLVAPCAMRIGLISMHSATNSTVLSKFFQCIPPPYVTVESLCLEAVPDKRNILAWVSTCFINWEIKGKNNCVYLPDGHRLEIVWWVLYDCCRTC